MASIKLCYYHSSYLASQHALESQVVEMALSIKVKQRGLWQGGILWETQNIRGFLSHRGTPTWSTFRLEFA